MSRRLQGKALRALAGITGVLGISVAALVAVPFTAQATGEIIYAAPEGKAHSCSVRQPCSVEQAKTSAARLAEHSQGDVHVVLAGGTYRLGAPLRFGPEDSGRNGNRIIWEAAPGEQPVLSGGVPIGGWHSDAENPSLWSASVPAGLDTRQLYADGQRIPRSSGTSPVSLTQTADGFVAANDTLASWRNPSNIEFVFDGGHGAWTQPRCDVASISGETITMRQPCWSNMFLPSTPVAPDGDNPSGGFPSLDKSATPTTIENAYELLSPGTWYLDQTRHVIYYDPRPGENPAAMSFVAPVLQQLVTTSSTAEDPLHDVTFSGITFAYTTWLEPSTDNGFPDMQSTMYIQGPNGSMTQGLCQYASAGGTCPFAGWSRPPAAVDLVGTENVSITSDVFEHLGAAGLGTYHGARNDLISGNEITDVSGNGIEFGSTDDPQPTTQAEISVGNTITDNYIHNVGVEYTGAVGIWGGYARKTTISHNEIGDLPYSGISYGWGGWHTNATTPFTNPNIQADNVISDNMIYNVMGVRQDGGPIYTNGPQGQNLEHGLTLKGNVTFGNKHTNFAYYNDEGGAYITIDGDVQYADSGSFNGGCSTTGHIVVKNSYYVGRLNNYVCDNVGTDFVDGGGNTLIVSDPAPGTIPSSTFTGAGLQPAFRSLSTRQAPAVLVVSSIVDHQVMISGHGFTPTSSVQINGTAATQVDYIGPNQITATLPSGVNDGNVTVTTAAGTSAIDNNSYTNDPTDNVSWGKPATQSSTAFGSPASNAVDGNTNGDFNAGSISHTGDDQYAWWQVDLGWSQALSSISLWNRTDCCSDRATDYRVFVSDTPFDHSLTPAEQAAQPGVWSNHQIPEMGRPTRLPASTTGRYVMVQLAGTNYLALAEVQVFRGQIQAGPPITLASLSPNQLALPGGSVTLTGTNFTPDTKVSFGGVDAGAIQYTSPTKIAVTAPAAKTPGAVDVVVSSPSGGSATLKGGFTYFVVCGALPCTYKAYDPSNTLTGGARIDTTCTGCPEGTKVGGLGFGAYVTINNVFAPADGQYKLTILGVEGGGTQNYKISVNGGTPDVVPLTGSDWNAPAAPISITIRLSAGRTNMIKLGNDTDWSPDVVQVTVDSVDTSKLPTITSISPSSVPLTGGIVTVTGTNFTPDTTISFGGIAAGQISNASSTSFTVIAPASPKVGAVDVAVDASTNGTNTAKGALTYTALANCTASTCTYQAWDPANDISGGGSVAACVGCPYGLKVGGLGHGAGVTINHVYAPADGNYTVTLISSEGAGTQTAMVSANGGTANPVYVSGNNWFLATQPFQTTLALKAGSSNTITIGNNSDYSPDVVSVTISPGAVSPQGAGQTVVMNNGGNSQVTYDLATGLATYSYAGVDKVKDFYSSAYSGATLYKSTSAQYTRNATIGQNGEWDVTLTALDGSPTMVQRFILSDKHFLVQIELDGTGLSSNEMSPVVMETSGGVDLGNYGDTRFLQVPYDNDGFVTYNAASSNGAGMGFEVGAFYDNVSRNGIVVGAVTHDIWKSAVEAAGSSNKIDMLWAYGGANDSWDQLPHGSIAGNKLLSPTVMVGYYPDWRDGMEEYAAVNAQFVPKLAWNAPAPQGWGALGNHDPQINASTMTKVADYFHNTLPGWNNQGVQYINMDAYWGNLSDSELSAFVQHVHSQGQKAGIYWTPWVVWNWNSPSTALDGVNGYTVNDVVMKKSDGTPMASVDGAFGVDPTSAGAKARVDAYIARFKQYGFDYIKLDFLSHGMLEGGNNNAVHADPAVHTGEQAFNQGMAYLYNKIGNSMFIDESIAPIFPYQYAHARRVSCDTFGAIGDTGYEMNSESYGWWLAGTLYNWNDPDLVHLVNDDTTKSYSLMENKSNVTSKAVAGYMSSGDDVTIDSTSSLVQQWMSNASINGIPALNLHFRPVEGNTGTSSVNLMVAAGSTPGTYYLAVFNFDKSQTATQNIDLGRAGLSSTANYAATDLWSNASSTVTGTMSVSLQAAESTIIKLVAK